VQHIGLGTAAIGRPQYINIKQEGSLPDRSKKAEFDYHLFISQGMKVLEDAYQLGIRYFDTAPGYGAAEQILIDWLKKKNDPTIEVATKWGYTYMANFDPKAAIHEIKDHSLNKLIEQWEKSKELMPNLSTLQVHSATFESGILKDPSILKRLAELKSEYNLHIGITTSGHDQVEVLKYAMDIYAEEIPLFDIFQVTYNILDQSLVQILDEFVQSRRRIVVKEAMANGRLFRNSSFPHYTAVYDNLEKMAKKYKAGVDAVALRFCLDSIHPFMVLSGASQSIQIEENLRAKDFKLEEEDLTILKSFKLDPKLYWSERKQLSWL